MIPIPLLLQGSDIPSTSKHSKLTCSSGRRIRTIIEPAGFELVDGKVTAKDGSGKPGDGEDDDSAAAPATPAKGKRGMPKTPASKRGNKKRKVEEDDDDEMAHKIEEELKSKDEV